MNFSRGEALPGHIEIAYGSLASSRKIPDETSNRSMSDAIEEFRTQIMNSARHSGAFVKTKPAREPLLTFIIRRRALTRPPS